MGTAAVQNVRMVMAAAAARGVAPGALLAASDLDARAVIAADGRVPAEAVLRVWCAAAERTGDPWFGLSVATHLATEHLDLALALAGSATLGDALRQLVRFFPLINQQAALALIEDGARVRVRLVVSPEAFARVDLEQVRHPTECLLAVLLRLARHTTGLAVAPLAVALRHAAPRCADLSGYHLAFGIAPGFGAPCYELVFDRAVLDLPQRAPGGDLAALAERQLRRRCDELPAADSFAGRIRRALAEELELGEPTLPRLAERLRMSERTLQRRLGAEATSVQALLDDVRRELSLRRLADSTQSIAEISFGLGFAEVRAFHRAFKRWTGSTPAAYRQARSAS